MQILIWLLTEEIVTTVLSSTNTYAADFLTKNNPLVYANV